MRLVYLTGKSKYPIHPKHLIKNDKLWYKNYLKRADVILDLGCGTGSDLQIAALKVRKAIGADIDEKQIKNAAREAVQNKISNIKYMVIDANKKLPFKDKLFDKVVLSDVLEHLDNRDLAINEVKRVIKNKGLLFLVTDNPDTSWKKIQKRYGLFYFADPDHKYEYPKEEIVRILRNNKFSILSCNISTYDTPFKGLIDLIGGISLSLYKKLRNWRMKMAIKHPEDATGFMIVAQISK